MIAVKEKLKNSLNELVKEAENLFFYEVLNRRAKIPQPNAKLKYSLNPKTNEQFATAKKDLDEKIKDFSTAYQNWYSKASITVRQIMPDRYDEFIECYRNPKRGKEFSLPEYSILDYLSGIFLTGWDEKTRFGLYATQFRRQISILKSCLDRLDSILSDIKGILQADLFDSELSAAEDLMKKGHLRAAGALAGVTLERHFATVASNHSIKISKKNPTIADFNETFKSKGIYDLPTYRKIQVLGDIRNLSSHFKSREPTEEEVEDMIRGADRILKMVF